MEVHRLKGKSFRLLVVIMVSICLFTPGRSSVLQPVHAAVSDSIRADSYYTNLSDHLFLDQSGSAFDPSGLMGKFTLVNFVFTYCGTICPVQTMQLAQAVSALPESVSSQLNLVSIALDPANDTPETLRKFQKNHGADLKNWSFIVGDRQATDDLSERLSLVADKADLVHGQINHRTDLWLIDKHGVLLHIYPGNSSGIKRIVEDLQRVVHL